MFEKISNYIDTEKERFLQELVQFIRLPSVSADPKYKNDLLNCAQWLVDHFKSLGFEARLIQTKGHPIVYAAAKGQSDKTLLIYGHYDVQPADPVDKWLTPPFEPAFRDGYIFARGATDDKGQLFTHIKAAETLIKTTGRLPCNLIFLIEGEEECGGNALEEYIKTEKDKLACDAVIISDTSMYDEKTPAITYGLRGIVAMEIKVRTAAQDLHSGVYGGGAGNANAALASIISKLTAPDGKVLIPCFYDNVNPLQPWEKQTFKKLAFSDKKLAKEMGAKKTFGDRRFPTLQRLWARPALDVNGLWGGYIGEGMKTIIPACATAKITVRLVPSQNPHKVANHVKKYIKSVCPGYAAVEIAGPLAAAEPVLFDISNPMIQAGFCALKAGFGAQPVFIRSGGSIPVVNTFWHELGKPVVLMGFGLDSDGAHSTNEKFKISSFVNGIKTSAHLLSNMPSHP